MIFLRRWLVAISVAGSLVSEVHSMDQAAKLRSFLDAHCTSCHDADSKKGGLDLTETVNWSLPDQMARWVRVHDRVAKGEMPSGKRKPAAEQTKQFLSELSQGLTQAHAAQKGTVLRRLNRLEYENTLHDLLGIRTPLAELLPEDGKSHGFDTVGAALDLSANQLQKYLDASDIALSAATRKGHRPTKITTTHRLDEGPRCQLGRLSVAQD